MRQSIHWRVRKMYRWTKWGTWPVSPHVKESKTVLDSGFHAVDSRSRSDTEFWIINFLPVELRFRIPIVSGIPDSLGCIPGCPTQISAWDSGFNKQKFPWFRNPDFLTGTYGFSKSVLSVSEHTNKTADYIALARCKVYWLRPSLGL